MPSDIPADTLMIDLQNNDITEIKENDLKKLSNLYVREIIMFTVYYLQDVSLVYVIHVY